MALLPATDLHVTVRGAGRSAGTRGIESARYEQPQWEAEIPLDVPAAAPFPKMVVSGGWSRAFEAICDVLEQRLSTERLVIAGAGHNAQFAGEPFNQRLLAFLRAAQR